MKIEQVRWEVSTGFLHLLFKNTQRGLVSCTVNVAKVKLLQSILLTVTNNSEYLIIKCRHFKWRNDVQSSQMASPARCWRTGGRWRSWNRQGSRSCRMTRAQKLAPTCRSAVSAGWSAARKERSRLIPLSFVASTISDGKSLTAFFPSLWYFLS